MNTTIANPSLTLPTFYAVEAARAAVLFASKDDVTPVICGAAFMLPDASAPGLVADRLRLVATDRYTVGRFTFPAADMLMKDPATPHYVLPEADEQPHTGWWLPLEALTYIAKLAIPKREAAPVTAERRVRIEWEVEHHELPSVNSRIVSVLIESLSGGGVQQSQRFEPHHATVGSFPPIERLIVEDPKPADLPVALNPEHLARPGTWAKQSGGKERMAVRFLATQASGDSHKPGPVLFRATGHHELPLVGLDGAVQPDLAPGNQRGGYDW